MSDAVNRSSGGVLVMWVADGAPNPGGSYPRGSGQALGLKSCIKVSTCGATMADFPKSRVLVVDDERVIADTLAIILNKNEFEATAVYTGEEAVEASVALQPDLLIVDIILPNMNGIEAAIQIHGLLPNCKIMLISGQAATKDLLEDARAQGYEYPILCKPIHPRDLLAQLRFNIPANNLSVAL